MRGAYSLRTTWKLYESHGEPFLQRWDAEQAPGEADAAAQEQRRQLQASVRSICLLGAGLFLFFTSLVPTAFQWAVKGAAARSARPLATHCAQWWGSTAIASSASDTCASARTRAAFAPTVGAKSCDAR